MIRFLLAGGMPPPRIPTTMRHAFSSARLLAGLCLATRVLAADALLDWSDWEKYRGTVQHPSGAIKPGDLGRARANLQRYAWARSYATSLERTARNAAGKLTPEYLAVMIPERGTLASLSFQLTHLWFAAS